MVEFLEDLKTGQFIDVGKNNLTDKNFNKFKEAIDIIRREKKNTLKK